MIAGLGTDIVEIERIEQTLARTGRFAQRILTDNEMAIFSDHNFPARYLAKRFAVKEAAVKALGTGIAEGVSFQDIDVQNLASGQPKLVLSGKFAEICEKRGITKSFVSISDEQTYATATVLLEYR
jgi:holo-[acyl-carrier protein] synthase